MERLESIERKVDHILAKLDGALQRLTSPSNPNDACAGGRFRVTGTRGSGEGLFVS